ncbi:MAG: hypothetical protein US74_C0018G0006 [Parcubacteria group bacterium GW2011_GWA2_38_13]|nr:MAG: hypothetical protein US74_C0018G0006 [Parcubacteria group bacterium GW2011_GWA2_38_13]
MKNTNKDISNQELLEFIKDTVATKDDLKQYATKTDLEQFATKDDLKQYATKTDLEQFATKDDLKEFKNDIIEKLDGVSKQLTDVLSENGANLSAHDRFEHRDEVFAKKLDLNLNAVDAES